MPAEDFIIYVYCCVEDVCREIVKTPLRRRGFQPKLIDSEVITWKSSVSLWEKIKIKASGDIFVAIGMADFQIWARAPQCETKCKLMALKRTCTTAFSERNECLRTAGTSC